jgi:hypothetical protein
MHYLNKTHTLSHSSPKSYVMMYQSIIAIAIVVCTFSVQTIAQTNSGKKLMPGQVPNTVSGKPEGTKVETVTSPSAGNTGTATGTTDATNADGAKSDVTNSGSDASGLKPDADIYEAPNTEGMSPARAAKMKMMAKNDHLKAKTANAEAKLADSKARIAKSKTALEAKWKKKKISQEEYNQGLAAIKTAEEKLVYLEQMIGTAKSKTF